MEGDWRTFTADEFVQDYHDRFESTSLSDAALRLRHQQGKRLNHDTLRLIQTGPNTPDVVATHRAEVERLRVGEAGVAPISPAAIAQLDVLLSARARARAARDQSPDVAGAKAEQQRMVRASEKIGEVAGSEWIHQKYPGPPPPKAIYPPDGSTNPPGSGVFDQIFQCTVVQDGRLHTVCVINEAKGGAGQLGSRMTKEGIRAGQGSPEYFEDILCSMEAKSGAEAVAAATVREAMADPAQVVKYLHIRATVVEAKGHDNGTGHSNETERTPSAMTAKPEPQVGQGVDIKAQEFDMSDGRPAPQQDAHRSAEPDSLPDADQDGPRSGTPSTIPPRSMPPAGAESGDPGSSKPHGSEGEPSDLAGNPATIDGTRTRTSPEHRVSSAPMRDEQESGAGKEPAPRREPVDSGAGATDRNNEQHPQKAQPSPVADEPKGDAGPTSEMPRTAQHPAGSPTSAPGDPESQADPSPAESLARADKPSGGDAIDSSGGRQRPGRSDTDRPRRPPSPSVAGLDRMREARSKLGDRDDGQQRSATERNPGRSRNDDDKGPDV